MIAIVAGSQIWDLKKINLENLVEFTLEKQKKFKIFPISLLKNSKTL